MEDGKGKMEDVTFFLKTEKLALSRFFCLYNTMSFRNEVRVRNLYKARRKCISANELFVNFSPCGRNDSRGAYSLTSASFIWAGSVMMISGLPL